MPLPVFHNTSFSPMPNMAAATKASRTCQALGLAKSGRNRRAP